MKKSIWGPCIWKLLHCFTIKIKDEYFVQEKNNIINTITNICANLPCPLCSTHAMQILKKYNFKNISTKENLIKIIFILHNEVNKNLKKTLFSYNKLIDTYNKYNFYDVLNEYNRVINQSNYNERMMLYTFHKKKFILDFQSYFLKNIKYYNI